MTAILRKHLPALIALIAVILSAILVLRSMGRPAWYKNGPPALWCGDIWSSQNSQQFTDPYTFTHILHGLIFYWLLYLLAKRWPLSVRSVIAAVLESGWEILENTPLIIDRYRQATISLDYYGDSVLNSVGDILAAILGFWFASRLSWRASLLVLLLMEAILALMIRDSLFINIIMLIHPIPALKAWQLGA